MASFTCITSAKHLLNTNSIAKVMRKWTTSGNLVSFHSTVKYFWALDSWRTFLKLVLIPPVPFYKSSWIILIYFKSIVVVHKDKNHKASHFQISLDLNCNTKWNVKNLKIIVTNYIITLWHCDLNTLLFSWIILSSCSSIH